VSEIRDHTGAQDPRIKTEQQPALTAEEMIMQVFTEVEKAKREASQSAASAPPAATATPSAPAPAPAGGDRSAMPSKDLDPWVEVKDEEG